VGTQKHPAIAYYVSAHGYGHGVRSCDIIRALNRLYPDIRVHVISGLDADFLQSRILADRISIRRDALDVGMVQTDSIRVDVDATLNLLERLYGRSEELIEREVRFLREKDIQLTVVDIPSIPLEAAERCGIAAVAVGNFGWDWVYSAFIDRDARWKPIVDSIRKSYAKADLLLRLPFCDTMRSFLRIEDIPLVASPGRSRRPEIAELLKCPVGKKWVLLSFTTLEWNESALDRVERLQEYEFITVYPLQWRRRNIHTIRREQVPFSDVVASVDAVVSKPGFGILSDCAVNRKPLIYADRSDFAEFAVLESAIRRYMKYRHIPSRQLYEGDLRPCLDEIWVRPEAIDVLPNGGDTVAAHRIARLAGVPQPE
jgi:hypothetical protein